MNPAEFTEIRFSVEQGVAHVLLDRPARRNAWNGRMAVEYRWALHHAHTRPDARVVVVSGAGGDFCVGADSRALETISSSGGEYAPEKLPLPPYPEGTPEDLRRNHAYPLAISTPVIAAIEGACAGAGFILATYADLRFAAPGSKITTSFATMGLPAEYGTGWLLPRIVGVANAALMLYSAEIYDAGDAERLGFVQRVSAPGELLDDTLETARRLARGSSGESLRTMKQALFAGAALPFGAAYTQSVEQMEAALRHPDMGEGLAALRGRRRPDFLASHLPGTDQ